jgi:hypothetical protein
MFASIPASGASMEGLASSHGGRDMQQ